MESYILDTNVLLSDPNAILQYADKQVLLPFIVLEELDNLKLRQDDVGARARESARSLLKLFSGVKALTKGVALAKGGKLKILATKRTSPTDSNDNLILGLCTENKDSVLVTNDTLLRLKAIATGIKTQQHVKNCVVENVSDVYTGFREVAVDKEAIAEIWRKLQNKEQLQPFLQELMRGKVPWQNEFVQFENGNTSKPLIFRYVNEEYRMVSMDKTVPKITPRNLEQKLALELLLDPSVKLCTIVGQAGVGKTLITLAAGLAQILEKKKYKSILVCRPIQPLGKDLGYLPGSLEEKLEPWIAPIKDNLRFLLTNDEGRKSRSSEQTLNYYFDNGIIEIEAMTYIRGRSIANAFMIIDESQNLNLHELKTIITRVGEGTKIVLTGDIEQIDNLYVNSVTNGLTIAVEKFKETTMAGHITLKRGERSDLASLAAKIL